MSSSIFEDDDGGGDEITGRTMSLAADCGGLSLVSGREGIVVEGVGNSAGDGDEIRHSDAGVV